MENILQNRSVDLQSGRYASVIIKQGDRDTRTVIFKLTDNGVPYTVPSGVSVYLSGTRADGSAIIQKLTINSEGNYPYTFTEYDTKIYGRSKCEIKLVEDATEKVLSSMTFVLVVEKSALSDQQIADAGDSRNLFKELVVALENAKKLQSIVDGLKDDVAGVEAIGKELSENEKERQANETVRIQNEEGRKNAEIDRESRTDASISSLGSAVNSANDLISLVQQTDQTAKQTIHELDDAIDRLNSSGSTSSFTAVISPSMPSTQKQGDIWFVADMSSSSITWENTSNGDYAFVQSGFVWTSNNKGVKSSTATSTWRIQTTEDVEYAVKYKVSSETSYDKFTLILDETTIIANGISGAGEDITYNASLSAGEHTLTAKYVKDSSQDRNDDCAYVILEPVTAGGGSGAVRKMATKTDESEDSSDYIYYPIGTDATYVTRLNGKTVEESLEAIESGSTGENIIVDDILSVDSTNPVANKAITKEIYALTASKNTINETLTTHTSKITALEEHTHTHRNSALLNALSYSDGKLYYNGVLISGGNTETHTHSNQSVLNLLSVSGGKLYYNGSAVSQSISVDNATIRFNTSNQLYAVNSHSHSNKSVLDLLSASGGKLYYNGSAVGESTSSVDYVPTSYTSGSYNARLTNNGSAVQADIYSGGSIASSVVVQYDTITLSNSYYNSYNPSSITISTYQYMNGIIFSSNGISLTWDGSSFYPGSNNSMLGATSNFWNILYSVSGVIQASDRNEKKDIQYLSEDYARSIIMGLKPCSYKFIENTSDRTHNGLIAQDVEDLLTSIGIESKDFAAFIKYEKKESDTDGNLAYGYGLRYEEFISPLIRFVQYQQHRIEDLEKRVEALER